jgi:hypothetical protein
MPFSRLDRPTEVSSSLGGSNEAEARYQAGMRRAAASANAVDTPVIVAITGAR